MENFDFASRNLRVAILRMVLGRSGDLLPSLCFASLIDFRNARRRRNRQCCFGDQTYTGIGPASSDPFLLAVAHNCVAFDEGDLEFDQSRCPTWISDECPEMGGILSAACPLYGDGDVYVDLPDAHGHL